jgi:hypothetical protein
MESNQEDQVQDVEISIQKLDIKIKASGKSIPNEEENEQSEEEIDLFGGKANDAGTYIP